MWPFRRKRKETPVPTPEEVMQRYGMSEDELTRRFLEHLIEQGKNPFRDMPESVRKDVKEKYPDLIGLAWRKFGTTAGDTSSLVGETRGKVPNWESLPSLAMIPVHEPFSYPELVSYVSKEAPDKELICIVVWGWTVSQEKAFQHIQYLYAFADDRRLVLMRFTAPVLGNEQLIIRASFMKETSAEVKANRLQELIEQLSGLAKARGLHTKTVEH